MAQRSLDNLLMLAFHKQKVRCQLHPDGISGQISQIPA
jgi:hypothetical protein